MKKHHMLLSALVGLALSPFAAKAESTGVASWYGAAHQGLPTSSGEAFDQEGMTAASRDLPLGARVRVTLHATGRSVVVRVNDRMGARSAVIDLSRGAAREIGLLGRGRGTVSIESASGDPVEVAEAPDDRAGVPSAPTHRRRVAHASQRLAGNHRLGHGASLTLARRVVDQRAARHRL